jgi:aspartate ammonia-lyase
MEPVIGTLFYVISCMTSACRTLRDKCVVGITANVVRRANGATASASSPSSKTRYRLRGIGRNRESLATGKTVHDIAVAL